MRKIRVNQVRCNRCGEVIVSRTRHDLWWCSCRSVAVDGGTDYLRRITGDTSASYTELSEYEGEPIQAERRTGPVNKYPAYRYNKKAKQKGQDKRWSNRI